MFNPLKGVSMFLGLILFILLAHFNFTNSAYTMPADYGYGDSYGDSYGDTYGNSYGDTYGNAYGDSYGDAYGDSYSDNYGNSYSDSYGESYSDSYGDSGPPPPPPPPPFTQYQPQPLVCDSPNNSRIRVSWQGSSGASDYEIFYLDESVGQMIDTDTFSSGATSIILTQAQGLIPGHSYGFVIRAFNGSGEVYSDNFTWSHQRFGFTPFPECVPPGAFSLTSGPTANCPAVDSPNVTLSWGPPGSSGATNYHVLYRDTADYVTREFPSSWHYRGNTVFSETVTGLTKGHAYGFLIAASKCSAANCPPLYNPFQAYSGNWTDVTPGATTYPNCSLPVIDFKLNNQTILDPPLSVKQTTPVTLTWDVTNATSCSASSIPNQSYWNVSVPVGLSGSLSLPAATINTKGTYKFTLTCSNNFFSGNSNLTLNITQLQRPYIQTTGGSVHTNESISIPQ